MSKIYDRKLEVSTFSSFNEENTQEYKRRKELSLQEKMDEFDVLQKRQWGADWANTPIIKKVTFEKIF